MSQTINKTRNQVIWNCKVFKYPLNVLGWTRACAWSKNENSLSRFIQLVFLLRNEISKKLTFRK